MSVQGVVVRPALAIPFFTGVAAFIGNIISLTSAIRNWQDTVINLALEKLQTFLDPFKPNLIYALDAIIEKIGPFEGTKDPSPLFAHISGENLSSVSAVKDKLVALKNSINSGDLRAVASTAAAIKDEAIGAEHAAQRAPSALHAEKLSLQRNVGQPQFRKLKQSEIAGLFSNLWSSIRCCRLPKYIFTS